MQEETLAQDTEAIATPWDTASGAENRSGPASAVVAVVEGAASVLVVVTVVLGVADEPPQPARATARAAQATHRTAVAGRASTHLLTSDPWLLMGPLYEELRAELVHPVGATHRVRTKLLCVNVTPDVTGTRRTTCSFRRPSSRS
jgi:hypothetical protein